MKRGQAYALAMLGAVSFLATSALIRPGNGPRIDASRPVTPSEAAGPPTPVELHAAPAPTPIRVVARAAGEAPPAASAPAPAAQPAPPARVDLSPETQQALIDALTADEGDARAAALHSLQGAPISLVLPLAAQVIRMDPDVRNRLTALGLITGASDGDTERDAVAQVLAQAAARTDDAVVATQAREAYEALTSGHERG